MSKADEKRYSKRDSSLLLGLISSWSIEDRLDLDETALGKGLDGDAGARRVVPGVVSLVDLVDFREIVHVNEVDHVLHGMFLQVEAVVLSEVREILEDLVCLGNHWVISLGKLVGGRVQAQLS